MSVTLVTFESPAAHHMIDDWRSAEHERGRLVGWEALANGCHIATMESGERLYIIPIDGTGTRKMLDEAVAWARGIVGDSAVHIFTKMLHFGKVPVKSHRWQTVQHLVARS